MEYYSKKRITDLPSRERANFINTISGFKSANLIGSKSKEGISNLAIFNSVIHLGSNPALLGFVLRPITVERHTYENAMTVPAFPSNLFMRRRPINT
ncbi:MAG: hypothetical protein AAGD17_03545 [Bacteroidota bacterium]